ncbi:MAG TPA: endonuclease III [Actinomycetota bacterium]|nr:endonuclease III [Actinomycetota bacterium]
MSVARARPRKRSVPPDPSIVRQIHRRLRRAFGPLDPPRRWEPVDELMLTILSQNTSDVNRDRAWASLRERFPTWDALAAARPAQVAAAIKVGGLSNVKAPRILDVLREIRAREGGFDLGWMRTASDEEITEYLTSLPGVGPKTAACVLAFSLDRPALPVDTHVHRVATRLGFMAPGTPATKAHVLMADAVPPRLRVAMHVGLIRLGREICKAGRPRCEICPLQDVCPTAPLYLKPKRRGAASRRVS